jgi:hypothetical protein
VNLVERDAPCWRVTMGWFLGALVLCTLTPGTAIAQAPTASSNFIGFEDPLSEDGAWVALTTMAAQGTQRTSGPTRTQPKVPEGPRRDR